MSPTKVAFPCAIILCQCDTVWPIATATATTPPLVSASGLLHPDPIERSHWREINIMFLAILCGWFLWFFCVSRDPPEGEGGHSDTDRLAPGHPNHPERPGGWVMSKAWGMGHAEGRAPPPVHGQLAVQPQPQPLRPGPPGDEGRGGDVHHRVPRHKVR